ncbi:MAG: phosphatase PAP2 family protein [Anaerolineales bacterium]
MDILLQVSLSISIWFQNLGDWLFPLMKGVTFLGNEEFYLLVMPALYWCVDKILGIQIGVLLLLSGGTNFLLKLLFHSPRPFWVSSKVKNIVSAENFGFPSGHAQNAASLWGYIALRTKRGWLKAGVILVIFLIGVSRIILGVHFVHDVLVGWMVGIVLLILFLLLERPVSTWYAKQPFRKQILTGFLSSLVLIILALLFFSLLMDYQIPSAWIQNTQGELDPFNLEGIITISGVLFGLLAGLSIIDTYGGFQTKGTLVQRAARFIIGASGVLLIWGGLDFLFPEEGFSLALTLRYFRYLLVGLWISLGAPWFFIRLNLAQKEDPAP